MEIRHLKNDRWNSLWSLRQNLLNLLNVAELLIELPLAVPYCGICLIADLVVPPKPAAPAHPPSHG